MSISERPIVNWTGVGVDVCLVYVHSVKYEHLFGVMVFHRCTVNLSQGYMYFQYMCILLYV